jgi:hypothetical protein
MPEPTWTQLLDDAFTGTDTSVGAAGSTTGLPDWIDQLGNVWHRASNRAAAEDVGSYNTKFLKRPPGEDAIDQRIDLYPPTTGFNTLHLFYAVLRKQASNQCYAVLVGQTSATQLTVYLYRLNPDAQIGSTQTYAVVSGHQLRVKCYAYGTSPTTVGVQVFDEDNGGELGGIVNGAVFNVRGKELGLSEIDGTANGRSVNDFGSQGYGFWGMSGGPFFIRGLYVNGFDGYAVARVNVNPVNVPLKYLTGDDYAPLRAWAEAEKAKVWNAWRGYYPVPDAIPAAEVPIFDRGVVARGARRPDKLAALYWGIQNASNLNHCRSLIEGWTLVGCCFLNGYSNWFDFINNTITGDPTAPLGCGIGHTGVVEGCNFIGNTVTGCLIGLQCPSRGDVLFSKNTLACSCDILILNQSDPNRYVAGSGKPTRSVTIAADNVHQSPSFDIKAFPVRVTGGTTITLPAVKQRYATPMKFVWDDIDNIKAMAPDNPYVYSDEFHWKGNLGADLIRAPHPTNPGQIVCLYFREECADYPLAGLPIPPKYLAADVTTTGQLYKTSQLAFCGVVPVEGSLEYPGADCRYGDAPPVIVESPKLPVAG